MLDIDITQTSTPKEKPRGDLGFGHIFTDHMFLMDYTEDPEKGGHWHDARIVPYGDFTLSPASAVFHYGQEMFEGMKAYKGSTGEVYLFRPEMNAARTNVTNERICIPPIPEADYVQAISALVALDRDWVPDDPGTSLYIRPFIIATEPYLGVTPSKNFLFAIIMSPSGLYYKNGLEPVSIWVEDTYVRAVRGGVGFTKTGGNYAASLAAQQKAYKAGFDQVLWLDGTERTYIEEVGSMNVFFKIGGKIVTPALNGSILPGITRDSVITLCRDWGYTVEERLLSIDELIAAQQEGILEEAFGTGTAAVITAIGKLHYKGENFSIGLGDTQGKIGPLSKKLYGALTGIQNGELEDRHSWRVAV
ncbi:MAG: branched-chain amino acid aminotransferase [Coriobacteriia bacterium]|nr:branched-chain amino acid aminotransferase [Coriobacteriia bacterium]